jgi:hypothetical protein
LKPLRTVGIEHRHHVQLEPIEQARDEGGVAMSPDVIEHIEKRDSCRGLVAVHLRPQEHLERATTEPHVVDRSALDGLADWLHPNQIGCALLEPLECANHVGMTNERRLRKRQMLGVPRPAKSNWRGRSLGVKRCRKNQADGMRKRKGTHHPPILSATLRP